ncbi:MAG: tetratricopeptide repeat protein [Desulfovibrionaceae bacterium]|nr:tetratricopeptide repeat protein [Desulfovibrionaceae bacterium]
MAQNSFLDDSSVALLLDIANLACHKGFPGEAREIVDGILAVKPDFVPAKITLAFSHLVVNEFAEAHTILEGILADNPMDADARVIQGLAYLLEGKQSEAQESFAGIPDGTSQKVLAQELAQTI